MRSSSSRVKTRPVGLCGGVDDDGLGALGEGVAQALRVEVPARRFERDEDRLGAGEDRIGAVVLVERVEDDHLIAGVDQGEEDGGHGLRGAARHGDLLVGVDRVVVHAVVLLGDRQPQRRRPPRDRVLVHVAVDGGARGVLHHLGHGEVGKALREVDRAVLLGDACHLADDRLGEARGACCRHMEGDLGRETKCGECLTVAAQRFPTNGRAARTSSAVDDVAPEGPIASRAPRTAFSASGAA